MRFTIITILLLTFIGLSNLQAQSEVYFEMQVNESNYTTLQRAGSDKGITIDDVAKWMSENTRIGVKADNPPKSILSIFVVDERGTIVGESRINANVASSMMPLGRAVNPGELARAIQSAFPSDTFIPGDTLFPSDTYFPSETFFPGDTLIGGTDEAKRMISSAGQRALGQVNADGKKAGLFLMLSPAEEGQLKFDPGISMLAFHI